MGEPLTAYRKTAYPMVTFWLLGFFVAGIALSAMYLSPEKGRDIMNTGRETAGLNVAIPAIDAALPARIETATFALG